MAIEGDAGNNVENQKRLLFRMWADGAVNFGGPVRQTSLNNLKFGPASFRSDVSSAKCHVK